MTYLRGTKKACAIFGAGLSINTTKISASFWNKCDRYSFVHVSLELPGLVYVPGVPAGFVA